MDRNLWWPVSILALHGLTSTLTSAGNHLSSKIFEKCNAKLRAKREETYVLLSVLFFKRSMLKFHRSRGKKRPNARACFKIWQNEWVASNRIPVYAQRVLGSQGGKTLQVAVRKCMAKTYLTSRNRFGQCWYVARVSFCLNNHKIWGKIYSDITLLAWGLLWNWHLFMVLKYYKIRYKSGEITQ